MSLGSHASVKLITGTHVTVPIEDVTDTTLGSFSSTLYEGIRRFSTLVKRGTEEEMEDFCGKQNQGIRSTRSQTKKAGTVHPVLEHSFDTGQLSRGPK